LGQGGLTSRTHQGINPKNHGFVLQGIHGMKFFKKALGLLTTLV